MADGLLGRAPAPGQEVPTYHLGHRFLSFVFQMLALAGNICEVRLAHAMMHFEAPLAK